MTDQNNDAPQINILPADSHGDILVQLIKGQERAATQIELQNNRLFGGNGQKGSIPALFELQQTLATKLDTNKNELVDKIDGFHKTLAGKIDDVEDKHNVLDKKMNWYAGGLAALGSAATLVMGYIGIRVKTGH